MTSPLPAPGVTSSASGAKSCRYCHGPMIGKRRHAVYCSKRCRAAAPRRARRQAVALLRPFCMICGSPMTYRETWQGKGATLSQTTCSRRCAVTKYNWFRRVNTSTDRQRAKWREASARRRARMKAA